MIYSCIPQKVSRIWGSLPPDNPREEPTGEVWWFFSGTVLENSIGERKKLTEFYPGSTLPFVVKTLHAARNLSVQVHPGRDGREPVKDESWVVLSGHGKILHGTVDGTTPASFERALKNGTVETLLEHIEGIPGVFVHLPAGTIHALGGGLTVLEVQLNCAVTYRLWDYGRKGINGKLRELHTEEGLEAVNWRTMGRATIVAGEYLNAGKYFMQRTEPGVCELKPFELVFLPDENLCYFADGDGGTVSASGVSWIIGVSK